MPRHPSFRLRSALLALAALLASSWLLPAAQAATIRFTRRTLMLDANEGCAVADLNRDGRPDVVAGRNWYAAPDFVPRPLRLIEDWRSYAQTNGDHVLDVDGDGWLDVIGGYWGLKEVHWFRNPGRVELQRGRLWQKHLLANIGTTTNEAQYLRDLDGDGTPEWIINNWNANAPLDAWKLGRDPKGKPAMTRCVLGPRGHGHGMGFGDINGDGREDILVGVGWYERPPAKPLATPWTLHRDWRLHASCPMIVADLDGDGRNDVLYGNAHKYGLFWMQQQRADGGAIRWKTHLIDKSWSQPHCLVWQDLDADKQPELITGKRVRAHDGKDPGGGDPPCLYYYTWDRKTSTFTRHVIDEGTVGIGMQIRTADLNADGRTDILVAGKAGTYILLNQGK